VAPGFRDIAVSMLVCRRCGDMVVAPNVYFRASRLDHRTASALGLQVSRDLLLTGHSLRVSVEDFDAAWTTSSMARGRLDVSTAFAAVGSAGTTPRR